MKNKNKLNNMKNEYAVEITTKDGSKRYYLNGIIHREDGPAIECKDGYQAYYLNGNLFTKTEWEKKVSLLEKKEINYDVYEVAGPVSWW